MRCDARSIADRARAIAVEQSVEMPVSAIDDDFVFSRIVGRVEEINEAASGLFRVRIALAAETVGPDAGQLINMLFGNTSLHDDVVLHDVVLAGGLAKAFAGPHHGLEEIRRRAGAPVRALTCSALKPQGLPAGRLAELARRFADGGIDYVKDDHGLADQAYAPFIRFRTRFDAGRSRASGNPYPVSVKYRSGVDACDTDPYERHMGSPLARGRFASHHGVKFASLMMAWNLAPSAFTNAAN